MSVLNIRKALREGARVVIGIAGVSGSGKTKTAIELAYGMTGGDGSKVGFLDTENRRGSLYADEYADSPFLVGDLIAPFSPERYSDAILEFQSAGVEVLVIDSASHEWEGQGGCEDIANSIGAMGWNVAKKKHKAFVNTLLQCNMHIIVCLRAREKTDFTDKKNPRSLGIQPICEKNFMFELTASMMMDDQGRRQKSLKCPGDLKPYLAREQGYITREDGAAIRAWVDGAKQLDPEVERARNTVNAATLKGTVELRKAWASIGGPLQNKLGAEFLETAKRAAADAERVGRDAVDPEAVGRFNAAEEEPVV
jgi:hypothetical protein